MNKGVFLLMSFLTCIDEVWKSCLVGALNLPHFLLIFCQNFCSESASSFIGVC
jgi:hypothetical protein